MDMLMGAAAGAVSSTSLRGELVLNPGCWDGGFNLSGMAVMGVEVMDLCCCLPVMRPAASLPSMEPVTEPGRFGAT